MLIVPPGHTESGVLHAIESQVNVLAPGFAFAYYGVDDVKQQARIYAMNCLSRYDTSRPLENFLYTHIKNRLINLRRDKLRRTEPACRKCAAGYPCNEGYVCDRHAAWLKRNDAKANLARPVNVDYVPDENERNFRSADLTAQEAEGNELERRVDTSLPAALRGDYLRLRDGVRLPKDRREAVREAVRQAMTPPGDGEAVDRDEQPTHEAAQAQSGWATKEANRAG